MRGLADDKVRLETDTVKRRTLGKELLGEVDVECLLGVLSLAGKQGRASCVGSGESFRDEKEHGDSHVVVVDHELDVCAHAVGSLLGDLERDGEVVLAEHVVPDVLAERRRRGVVDRCKIGECVISIG